MNTLRFQTNWIDKRKGICTTSIYLVTPGRYSPPYYKDVNGKGYVLLHSWIDELETLLATIPGYVGYDEQREWEELLLKG